MKWEGYSLQTEEELGQPLVEVQGKSLRNAYLNTVSLSFIQEKYALLLLLP